MVNCFRGPEGLIRNTQGIVSLRPEERNSLAKITVPIALIIFKRTEPLQRIVDELNKHEISKLTIVADGPRTTEEKIETSRARAIAESVKTHEVTKVYSNENLGLKQNLTSGISQAVSQSEHLIVLEDDCLPSAAFLETCSQLTENLATNEPIAGLCGSTFLPSFRTQRLWRSAKFNVWGWMVDRNVWLEFIDSGFLEMGSEELQRHKSLLNKLPPLAKWEMLRIIKGLGNIDTWDIQFEMFCLSKNYDFLKPTQNLVTNIGFGEGATNTAEFGESLSLKAVGEAIEEASIPPKRQLGFEWLEHSTKFVRLLIELMSKKLTRRL